MAVKFGRNVPRVNTVISERLRQLMRILNKHQLTESFGYDVILSIWRPWRHDTQKR